MLRRLMMNTYREMKKQSSNSHDNDNDDQIKPQSTHIHKTVEKNNNKNETSNSSFFPLLFVSRCAFCVLFAFCLLFCVFGASSFFFPNIYIYIGMAHNRINHDDEGNVYASPSICLSFQSHFSWCFIHSFDEKSRKRIRHKSIRFYLCKS